MIKKSKTGHAIPFLAVLALLSVPILIGVIGLSPGSGSFNGFSNVFSEGFAWAYAGNYSVAGPFSCGANCSNGYEIFSYTEAECEADPVPCFNTIDDCRDGTDYSYEYVDDISVSDLTSSPGAFSVGDLVLVTASLDCDFDGDTIHFVYNNGSGWKNINMTPCQGSAKFNKSYSFNLDSVVGNHSVRVAAVYGLINPVVTCGYDGDNVYSDTDDVTFAVDSGSNAAPPSVTGILPPQGTTYVQANPLTITIQANVTDDILVESVEAQINFPSGLVDSAPMSLAEGEDDLYEAQSAPLSEVGRYNITIVAMDSDLNVNDTEMSYVIVVASNVTIETPPNGLTTNETSVSLAYLAPLNATVLWTGYSIGGGPNTTVSTRSSIMVNGTNPYSLNESSANASNISMSFTLQENLTVSSIALSLRRAGSGRNSTLQVRAHNSTTGIYTSAVLAKAQIVGENLSQIPDSSFSFVNFTLNQTISLAYNTTYWLYLNSTGNSTDGIFWEASNETSYSGSSGNLPSLDLFFLAFDLRKYRTNLSLSYGINNITAFVNMSPVLTASSAPHIVTRDNTSPMINSIVVSPNSTAGLDPGIKINVTSNITENLEVARVTLQYLAGNESSFSSLQMTYSNSSKIANGSFVPAFGHNYTVRVLANDTSGFSSFAEANLSVEYEVNWSRSPVSFVSKGGPVSSSVALGNITINNTGDLPMQFSLNSTADTSPVVWISNFSFALSAGTGIVVAVNATTPSISGTFNVTVNITTPNSSGQPFLYTSGTLYSNVSGIHLVAEILVYASSVSPGDTRVQLSGRVTNVGTDAAANVTLNWTLPSGWDPKNNQSLFIAQLLSGQQQSLSTLVDINSSAAPGTYSLILTANNTNSSSSDSRLVTVVSGSTPAAPSSGGGSDSSPTFSSVPAVRYGLNLTIPNVVEGVKGKPVSFLAIVKNPHRTPVTNITFYIEGFLASRTEIVPSEIPELVGQSEEIVNVTLDIPSYSSLGRQSLTFSASSLSSAAGHSQPAVSSRQFSLDILGSSESDTRSCIRDALVSIDAFDASLEGISRQWFYILVRELRQNAARAEAQQEAGLLQEAESACASIGRQVSDMESFKTELESLWKNSEKARLQGFSMSKTAESIEQSIRYLGQGEGSYDEAKQALLLAQGSFTRESFQGLGPAAKAIALFRRSPWLLLAIVSLAGLVALSLNHIYMGKRLRSRVKSISAAMADLEMEKKMLQKRFFIDKLEGEESYADLMRQIRVRECSLIRKRLQTQLGITRHRNFTRRMYSVMSLVGIGRLNLSGLAGLKQEAAKSASSSGTGQSSSEEEHLFLDGIKKEVQRQHYVEHSLSNQDYLSLVKEIRKLQAQDQDSVEGKGSGGSGSLGSSGKRGGGSDLQKKKPADKKQGFFALALVLAGTLILSLVFSLLPQIAGMNGIAYALAAEDAQLDGRGKDIAANSDWAVVQLQDQTLQQTQQTQQNQQKSTQQYLQPDQFSRMAESGDLMELKESWKRLNFSLARERLRSSYPVERLQDILNEAEGHMVRNASLAGKEMDIFSLLFMYRQQSVAVLTNITALEAMADSLANEDDSAGGTAVDTNNSGAAGRILYAIRNESISAWKRGIGTALVSEDYESAHLHAVSLGFAVREIFSRELGPARSSVETSADLASSYGLIVPSFAALGNSIDSAADDHIVSSLNQVPMLEREALAWQDTMQSLERVYSSDFIQSHFQLQLQLQMQQETEGTVGVSGMPGTQGTPEASGTAGTGEVWSVLQDARFLISQGDHAGAKRLLALLESKLISIRRYLDEIDSIELQLEDMRQAQRLPESETLNGSYDSYDAHDAELISQIRQSLSMGNLAFAEQEIPELKERVLAGQRRSFLFGVVNDEGKFGSFVKSAYGWIAANPAIAVAILLFACLLAWIASRAGHYSYVSFELRRMSANEEKLLLAMKRLQRRYFVSHAMDSQEYRQEFRELQAKALALRQRKDVLTRKLEKLWKLGKREKPGGK